MKWPCRMDCTPNYDADCPEEWISDRRRGTCVAPAAYAGDCAYEINVADWGLNEKEAFAAACAAPYPCSTHAEAHATGAIGPNRRVENGPIDTTGSVSEGM